MNQIALFDPMTKNAIFSKDRQYRYVLSRIWDKNKSLVMFIGLNPSTANETTDDNTIRRVRGYAKDWGYGGVYMTNLFAVISTDPKLLLTHPNPIGDDNDEYLNEIAGICNRIIFAWGGFAVNGRDQEIIRRFPHGLCLVKNSDGTPHHPLRLSKTITPVKFLG